VPRDSGATTLNDGKLGNASWKNNGGSFETAIALFTFRADVTHSKLPQCFR
jgi:hypothetical protein